MDMHRWAAAACLGHAAEDRAAAAQTLPPDASAATFPRRPSEGLLAAI